MMMPPLHCNYHHRNTPDRTQWIEEKWDLTFQMIWYNGMPNYPVWLIEVEEDLFLNSFSQLYKSKRMMMLLHFYYHHRNNCYQSQWIEEKWDLTLQMIWYTGMLHHPVWLIEVEEDLFLISFFQLYQSNRMIVPNRNIRHQYQRFLALLTLSIQTILLIGMPYCWYWTISMTSYLPRYFNKSWIRVTIIDGALLNA